MAVGHRGQRHALREDANVELLLQRQTPRRQVQGGLANGAQAMSTIRQQSTEKKGVYTMVSGPQSTDRYFVPGEHEESHHAQKNLDPKNEYDVEGAKRSRKSPGKCERAKEDPAFHPLPRTLSFDPYSSTYDNVRTDSGCVLHGTGPISIALTLGSLRRC